MIEALKRFPTKVFAFACKGHVTNPASSHLRHPIELRIERLRQQKDHQTIGSAMHSWVSAKSFDSRRSGGPPRGFRSPSRIHRGSLGGVVDLLGGMNCISGF